MIIDATDMIVGRMANVIAKKLLLGEKVDVINCEKAVFSGKPETILARYKQKAEMGAPKKGPFSPRMPDRLLRRSIKGMLPLNKTRGKEAFKNVMCYIGVPAELKDKKAETIKEAHADKLPSIKKITVGEICKYLGGKWNE